MSNDAKPGYLLGRVRPSRGRGNTYHASPADRGIQRLGRQNKGWRNQGALPTESTLSQHMTMSNTGGNYAL